VIRLPLSQSELRRVVRDIAAGEERWLTLVRYTSDTRWYQRLVAGDDHDVWLISWLPGQGTGFHDHGSSSGAFAVAQGALHEWAAPGGLPDMRGTIVLQGEAKSFGPWYVHHVINSSAQPAVSIHAYSPPLMSMSRFELTTMGLQRVTVETAGRW
jgi:predicted metal-dependent enzyme (double-stranded beta helix superfamily)